jgi:hypothetical protein
MPSFTTHFQTIPASAVLVRGLPAGAAASSQIPHEILSSLSGVFSISADTRKLIGDLIPAELPRRLAA